MRVWGHGIADGSGRGLGSGGIEGVEAGVDAVDGLLMSGGHAVGIEDDGRGPDPMDVGPGDGMGKVGKIVGEAAEGVAEFDVLLEGGLGELDDLVKTVRREMGGIGIEKLEARRVVDGVPAVERLLGHAAELGVEVLIRGGFGERQAAGDAVFFGGIPCGVVVEEGKLRQLRSPGSAVSGVPGCWRMYSRTMRLFLRMAVVRSQLRWSTTR